MAVWAVEVDQGDAEAHTFSLPRFLVVAAGVLVGERHNFAALWRSRHRTLSLDALRHPSVIPLLFCHRPPPQPIRCGSCMHGVDAGSLSPFPDQEQGDCYYGE